MSFGRQPTNPRRTLVLPGLRQGPSRLPVRGPQRGPVSEPRAIPPPVSRSRSVSRALNSSDSESLGSSSDDQGSVQNEGRKRVPGFQDRNLGTKGDRGGEQKRVADSEGEGGRTGHKGDPDSDSEQSSQTDSENEEVSNRPGSRTYHQGERGLFNPPGSSSSISSRSSKSTLPIGRSSVKSASPTGPTSRNSQTTRRITWEPAAGSESNSSHSSSDSEDVEDPTPLVSRATGLLTAGRKLLSVTRNGDLPPKTAVRDENQQINDNRYNELKQLKMTRDQVTAPLTGSCRKGTKRSRSTPAYTNFNCPRTSYTRRRAPWAKRLPRRSCPFGIRGVN